MGSTDSGEMLCNHAICQEHRLYKPENKSCEWSAKDFSTNEPIKRTFRVRFSSDNAVQEFCQVFSTGQQLARESDIWEVADGGGEIIIPQVAGIAKGDIK